MFNFFRVIQILFQMESHCSNGIARRERRAGMPYWNYWSPRWNEASRTAAVCCERGVQRYILCPSGQSHKVHATQWFFWMSFKKGLFGYWSSFNSIKRSYYCSNKTVVQVLYNLLISRKVDEYRILNMMNHEWCVINLITKC